MDGYKKIIKSQKLRMQILNALSFVPDKWMIKLQYYIKLKRRLDLKNPKRYTEKLQWLKLNYRNPVMVQCVDKYLVRDYIRTQGLSRILTELYGVFDSVEEIDFDRLPPQFIAKTTNGSGTNIICRDRAEFDETEAKAKLREYMDRPQINAGREWAYNGVTKRIVVEELLIDKENPQGGINDYKFICFDGTIACVVVDVDRYTDHKRNFYSEEWHRIDVESDHPNFDYDIEPPVCYDEMLEIAKKLSNGFPAVRVDLYCVNGKVYFGEMTFYPWSGYVQYTPDSFDYELGKMFVLAKHGD